MNVPVTDYDAAKRARFERILASQGDDYVCTGSQISAYEDCPRKWAWQYIDGIVPPDKPSTAFGTKVHKLLEDWFVDKKPPPAKSVEGRCAQKILCHLPHPGDVQRHNVELEADFRLCGVLFSVQFDLVFWDVEPASLFDHKTTGDFMWMKTDAPAGEHNSILDDVQFTLYSSWLFHVKLARRVRGQWTYGLSKASKQPARVTVVDVAARDIAHRVEKNIQSAREMRTIKSSGLRALDVVYDATACEKYGGCSFRDRCQLTAKERMASIMSEGEQRNAFLEAVTQKMGSPAPQQQAGPPQAVNPLLGGGAPQGNPFAGGTPAPAAGNPFAGGTLPQNPLTGGQSQEVPAKKGGGKKTNGAGETAAAPALPPEFVAAVVKACGVVAAPDRVRDAWVVFAAAAVGPMTDAALKAGTQPGVVLANPAAVADLAAKVADALVAQLAQRSK